MKNEKYSLMILLILTIFAIQNVQGVYFLFSKNSLKCFQEEFFKNTIVIFKYHTLEDIHDEKEHDHSPIFDIYLLNSETEKEVDSAQGINPSGRANFIIEENASYRICLIPNQDSIIFRNRDSFKLSISFESTDHEYLPEDLSKVPKNSDFDKIYQKIENVQKKVFDIMKYQKYQIYKEDEFSNRHLQNSSIIVYFTVIQIFILCVLTIWQVISFKNLFREKINI